MQASDEPARDGATDVSHDAAQRLRCAYEHDLPLTFTRYAAAQTLTRRPILYSDFLATLHAHVRHVRLQRGGRCDAIVSRLPGFFLEALELIFDTPAHTSDEDDAARQSAHDSCDAAHTRRPSQLTREDDLATHDDAACTLPLAQEQAAARQALLEYLFQPRDARVTPLVVSAAELRQLLYGMREIAPDTSEYLDTLHTVAAELDRDDVDHTRAERDTLPSATVTPTHRTLPDYVRSLLAAGQNVSTNNTTLYHTTSPVVKKSTEQLLDALVPPRLLVYFDVDPDRVEEEFRRRERHRRRAEQLRVECRRHHESKHLVKEMNAELAELDAVDPVVGEQLLLLERPSTARPLREDMERLEDGVDTALRDSRARCWGLPVQGTGYKRLMQQVQQRALGKQPPVHIVSAAETDVAAAATPVTAAPTTITSAAHPERAATSVNAPRPDLAPPHPTTRGGLFYTTVKPGTTPAALDETAGGSVSVTTTLNVLELNHERHVIYFHLLVRELLRQVTLDLPERGVLLAHLLNEAELSMHMHDVLLTERTCATGEHLLDGQESRSATAQALATLEREVGQMRERKAELEERQRSLQHWAAHRRAEDEQSLVRMKNFSEMVLERLRRHATEVQLQQDRERRDAHDA